MNEICNSCNDPGQRLVCFSNNLEMGKYHTSMFSQKTSCVSPEAHSLPLLSTALFLLPLVCFNAHSRGLGRGNGTLMVRTQSTRGRSTQIIHIPSLLTLLYDREKNTIRRPKSYVEVLYCRYRKSVRYYRSALK